MNIATLIGGVALSILLLEVALRIYNPIVQTVKGNKVILRVNYDELRRNTRISGVAGEIHIHQNSLGFRGAEPPTDLRDWLSIITVGGSTTRSATQSDNHTWTALLGDAVSNCFDRTWINNAGFEGHTSFAHIQLVQNYISKLRPKIVILLIGANEFYVDGAIDGPNAFDREQTVADLNFEAGIKGFFKGLSNRSEVIELGLTLYRSFRAWKVGLTYDNFDWPNLAEGQTMPPDGESRLAAAKDKQSAYAERLRIIIRLLQDGQTIPVLMTQPTVSGVARDPTTGKDLSRLQFGLFFDELMELFNETMRHVAQGEHVHLIDLARMMPKDTKYYWDSIHYTDSGAKEVAHLAAAALLPYLERMFPSHSRGNKGNCQIVSASPR
jgi:hypothetical protein